MFTDQISNLFQTVFRFSTKIQIPVAFSLVSPISPNFPNYTKITKLVCLFVCLFVYFHLQNELKTVIIKIMSYPNNYPYIKRSTPGFPKVRAVAP